MYKCIFTSYRCWIAAICMSLGVHARYALPSYGDTPATQPAGPTEAELAQCRARAQADFKKFNQLVGDRSSLRDATTRTGLRAELSPLWSEMARLNARVLELSPPHLAGTSDYALWSAAFNCIPKTDMIAVGDEDVVNQTKAEAASPDHNLASVGQLKLLEGEWLADPDEAAELKTADKMAVILKTADVNDKVFMGVLKTALNLPATTPAAEQKLIDVAKANYASDDLTKYLVILKKHKQDKQILDALGNKPLALTGTTVEGKPFSTEQWKGKVILVDFWASWCGPCKAELPRVEAMYKKYHDQGLEVLGVSNDYAKAALQKYLAGDPALVWPCLFDEASAANQSWNPLSTRYGIDLIPRMLLIDRDGICRTVEARDNMETMIPKLLAENPVAVVN